MSSSSRRTAAGAGAGRAVAGIAAVVALAFAPVLLGGRSFYHLDTYFQHVPFWHFAAETLARGEWPWWTPNIRAGYPLHANGEASLLYPLALPLGLALPAHRAVAWFGVLHLAALGAFGWRYLREIDVPPLLSFAGAAALALSGRMVASTIWPNAVAASCFLPLVLLGVERCRRDPRRGAAIVALAVALGLLAGRPQRFVPALLFAGAYAVTLGVARRRDGGAQLLLGAGCGALLGAALAAPQVLPTLQLVGDSIWADGLSRAVFEENSLKGRDLAQFFAPAGMATWVEGKLYPGVFVYVGLGVGIVRLLRGRLDVRAAFFAASALLCFWLALAGPGAYALCQAVPVLESLRSPVRFLFPASVALALLAVLGWRDVFARIPLGAQRAAVAAACAELVVVCWWTAPTAPSAIYEVRPTALTTFPDPGTDPAGFPYRFYASGHWVAPHLVDELDESGLVARFAALPLTRDLAMRFGRHASGGYGEPRLSWKAASYKRLAHNEVDALGVRRLFMGHRLRGDDYPFDRELGASFVYDNPDALPRALCVERLESAADASAALARAADSSFDPRRAAVVERPVDGAAGAPCEVRATQIAPTRVALDVRAEGPARLVLFDTWAPGWRATVDGAPVDVERANGMFRLVALPAGASRVAFHYRPPGLAGGLVESGVALAALVWLWRSGAGAMLRAREEAG